jgi:hypothetical protein
MLKNIFSRPSSQVIHPKVLYIVSGLPRSGTSMMMKMLAEGGLEIVSDAIRSADEDNPNGYFELEPVKELKRGNTQWLAGAQGKAVKIISSLLEYLPQEYRYKIIFMERDLQEILVSQQKMLKNRQEQSQMDDTQMYAQYEKHLATIKYWLARQPNMEVMYVSYPAMLSKPQEHCIQITQFLGIALNQEKMCMVPSQSLYRNRAKSG